MPTGTTTLILQRCHCWHAKGVLDLKEVGSTPPIPNEKGETQQSTKGGTNQDPKSGAHHRIYIFLQGSFFLRVTFSSLTNKGTDHLL